jgi:hypothetical protein
MGAGKIAALVAAGGLAAFMVAQTPELRRYLKIRAM